MSSQRLVIFGPNGNAFYPDAERARMRGEKSDMGNPAIIDMSGIPNANATAPLMLHVQKMCDLGGWHTVGEVAIPCWDDRDQGAGAK